MVDRGLLTINRDLRFVDERVRVRAAVTRMTPLPVHFIPSNYDVICGRGTSTFNHIGNRRFRVTIAMNLKHYITAATKMQKSMIVMSIVDVVRQSSVFGGFVKQNKHTAQWYEIGDDAAREKVGQAIREALLQRDPEERSKKRLKRSLAKARMSSAQGQTALVTNKSFQDVDLTFAPHEFAPTSSSDNDSVGNSSEFSDEIDLLFDNADFSLSRYNEQFIQTLSPYGALSVSR